MREKYESLALAELRAIAKSRGMKRISGLKKAELVELMLEEDEKDKEAGKDVEPKPVLRGMKEPSFAAAANKNERRNKPAKPQNAEGQSAENSERPAKEQSAEQQRHTENVTERPAERPAREARPHTENVTERPTERPARNRQRAGLRRRNFRLSLTAVSRRGESLKSCLTVSDLSGVIIFFPVRMMCMWRRARFAALVCAPVTLSRETRASRR